MSGLLQNKIALVTGGGGGIGRAICKKLASEGASIVITYSRSKDKAEQLAHELVGDGHLVIRTPVDDTTAQNELAQLIHDRYGKLDILVNNAGITKPIPHGDLDNLTDDIIDDILRVNVRGVLAYWNQAREG